MKADGVTMDTTDVTEPTEGVGAADPSVFQNIMEQPATLPEQAANNKAAHAPTKANENPETTQSKVKTQFVASKMRATCKAAGNSGSKSQAGTSSQHAMNSIQSSNNSTKTTLAKKTTVAAPSANASTAGTIPKSSLDIAAVSLTVRYSTKRPIGPAKTSGAATSATNGTKPSTMDGNPTGRQATKTSKPKSIASRPPTSAALKNSTLITTKVQTDAIPKTTRPATGPSRSRQANSTSRPTTVAARLSTTVTTKTGASRVTAATSTSRAIAGQPIRTASATTALHKDVSRPHSAATAKRPQTTVMPTTPKKPEPSKHVAIGKTSSEPKMSSTKAADPKVTRSKTESPAKPCPTKKPRAVATCFPTLNKLHPVSRAPPANSSTPKTKLETKPTRAVLPFTSFKGTKDSKTSTSEAELQATGTPQTAATLQTNGGTQEVTTLHATGGMQAAVLLGGTESIDDLEDCSLKGAMDMEGASVVSPDFEKVPDISVNNLGATQEASTQAEAILPADGITQAVASLQVAGATQTAGLLEGTENTDDLVGGSLKGLMDMEGASESSPDFEKVLDIPLNDFEEEDTVQGVVKVQASAANQGVATLQATGGKQAAAKLQAADSTQAVAPLEGIEGTGDLGESSPKGGMEGASAGLSDFEKVLDIPVNDFEEEDEDEDDDDDYDDNNRVCDMDVCSERTDEPLRPRHDNDEEDEDVEMASEGVTESGLESYGNADEDDFAEDERLDNLNRLAQPPPPPQLPSAPAAQWDQPNPFSSPLAKPFQQQAKQVAGAAAANPLVGPWQADSETTFESVAQAWFEPSSVSLVTENQEFSPHSSDKAEIYMYELQSTKVSMQNIPQSRLPALLKPLCSESSTLEGLGDCCRERKPHFKDVQVLVPSAQNDVDNQDQGIHMKRTEKEENAKTDTISADEIVISAQMSNPPSSSVTEDEVSDTEGEAQLDDSLEGPPLTQITVVGKSPTHHCLSTLEEGEEVETGINDETTPPSVTSLASYVFDSLTTASNSNAHSTEEICINIPGVFSLEAPPEEAKDLGLIQPQHSQSGHVEQEYIACGKQETKPSEHVEEEAPGSDKTPDPSPMQSSMQHSAICEKTENSFAGFTALLHPHRCNHAAYAKTECDILKTHSDAFIPPRLACTDLPHRGVGIQPLSPQPGRLEQHHRQLMKLQQHGAQQSKPPEETEHEKKEREERRRKAEETEEEIKSNEEERRLCEHVEVPKEDEKLTTEELKQRRDVELQLHQQQEELKQRQQIMQWQQELQQSKKGETVLLSPSSGLCTIYESLENSDEEAEGEEIKHRYDSEEPLRKTSNQGYDRNCKMVTTFVDKHHDSLPPDRNSLSHPESPKSSTPSQNVKSLSPCLPESTNQPTSLELEWEKKVDIVQQLINQTLLLNDDGCSSLMLLPGGVGGTLSPLESSLWPNLLHPLTPPSATVTSVSSFSPEATGSSPQGEWTVVELETHH